MEEKNDVVRFESEDGSSVEMAIIKEFEYNSKKYAVLMANTGCDCGCEDEKCNCEEDKCSCEEEKETETSLCILEVVNEDGKETFKDVEDKDEFEKIVKFAETTIFE